MDGKARSALVSVLARHSQERVPEYTAVRVSPSSKCRIKNSPRPLGHFTKLGGVDAAFRSACDSGLLSQGELSAQDRTRAAIFATVARLHPVAVITSDQDTFFDRSTAML